MYSVSLQTRSFSRLPVAPGIDSQFILPFHFVLLTPSNSAVFFCPGRAEFKGGLNYLLIYSEGPGGAGGRKTKQDPAAKESLQGVWSGGSFLSHWNLPDVPRNVLPPPIQVTKRQIIAFFYRWGTSGYI